MLLEDLLKLQIKINLFYVLKKARQEQREEIEKLN